MVLGKCSPCYVVGDLKAWRWILLLAEDGRRARWLLRVWSTAHALDEELEVGRSRGLAFCVHEVHCFLLHVCESNHVGVINLIQEHALKVIFAIQLRWCKPKRVSLHLVGKHAYYAQIGAFQSFLFAFFKFIKYQELY